MTLPKFLSIHIPKAAGTTFLEMLKMVYGADVYHHKGNIKPENYEDFSVIHGHFDINFYGDLAKKRPVITFIRDPAERVVSHYYYWRKHPDGNSPECKRMYAEGWTLEQFVERSKKNVMSGLLGPDLSRIDFIGRMEQFDEHLAILEQFLDVTFPRIARQNVGDKREISLELRDKIYQLNPEDFEIWKQSFYKYLLQPLYSGKLPSGKIVLFKNISDMEKDLLMDTGKGKP